MRSASSLDFCPRGDVRIDAQQRRLAVDRRGQHHAVRLDPHQLRRLEVGHDDHLASDQLLRRVLRGDAGDERALPLAVEDGQLDQLLRLLHFFRGADLGDAQVGLEELLDADLGQVRRRGLRGLDRRIRHALSSNVRRGIDARKNRIGHAHRHFVLQASPLQRVLTDLVGIGAEASERFARGGGEERRHHDPDDALRLERVPNDARERLVRPRFLEHLPRLARDDVRVDGDEQPPRRLQRALEREIVHGSQVLRHHHS